MKKKFLCLLSALTVALPPAAASARDWQSAHLVKSEGIGYCDDMTENINLRAQTLCPDGTYLALFEEMSSENAEVSLSLEIMQLDAYGSLVRTFDLEKDADMESIGDIAADEEGNVYIAYGRSLEEHQTDQTAVRLVKYSPEGERLAALDIKGNEDDAFNGIKIPFDYGSCDLSVNNGTVVCFFARTMFQSSSDGLNHQASYSFAAKADDLSRLPGQSTYASHSFEQQVYFDGQDFLLTERCDAYPRGFQITKKDGEDFSDIWTLVPMEFKLGPGGLVHGSDPIDYNYTFSDLGGIVATEAGYIFAGTYENKTDSAEIYSSRNVFVQTITENADLYSQPRYLTDYGDIGEGNSLSLMSGSTITNAEEPFLFDYGEGLGLFYIENAAETSPYNSDEDALHILTLQRNGELAGDTVVHNADGETPSGREVFYDPQSGRLSWLDTENVHGTYNLYLVSIEECTGDNCPQDLSSFTDIEGLSETAYEAMTKAYRRGIIDGYDDGTLRPYGEVTRAEFAQMVYRALNMRALTAGEGFSDVPSGHWAHEAVMTLANTGAVNGVGQGMFAPDDKVTAAQAAKMLTEAAGFADDAVVDAAGGYPGGYFTLAKNLGILDGIDAGMEEPLLRWELAQMIISLLP